MFGSRLLVNMACRSFCRPTMKIQQSYSTLVPIYTYKNLFIFLDRQQRYWVDWIVFQII